MYMSLNADTVQIQYCEGGIGCQILHFCYTVVGQIDLLKQRKEKVVKIFSTSH